VAARFIFDLNNQPWFAVKLLDCLEHVLTDTAYQHMIALGERFEAETKSIMQAYDLPWQVTRVGCRVEYLFRAKPAKNGSEALAEQDALLDPLIHLFMLNRGILLTPFHNMALLSPETTEGQVARHGEVFEETIKELRG
jgi:glutamate-1-semialdehyde 2,1-aminomutase